MFRQASLAPAPAAGITIFQATDKPQRARYLPCPGMPVVRASSTPEIVVARVRGGEGAMGGGNGAADFNPKNAREWLPRPNADRL